MHKKREEWRLNKRWPRPTGRWFQKERWPRQKERGLTRASRDCCPRARVWLAVSELTEHLVTLFCPREEEGSSEWQARSQWSLCCFSTLPSFDSYEQERAEETSVNKAKAHSLKESNYHCSLSLLGYLKYSQLSLWTLFFRRLTHTHTDNKCAGCWVDSVGFGLPWGKAGMDVGLSSLRSEAVGAVRTALVSAENLQLTLKTELSQEELALTHTKSSPKESHKAGYCSEIAHSTHRKLFLIFLTQVLAQVVVFSWGWSAGNSKEKQEIM